MGSRLFGVACLLICLSAPRFVEAQAPLPIVRGIIVMPTGEPRAYIEDAVTGHLASYAIGETVGDDRIIEIRDDRVVLGHEGAVVHLFIGGASAPDDPERSASAPPVLQPPMAGGKPAAVVDSGEALLEHLGIPAQSLSRAIERAPATGPDNLEDD